MSQKPKRSDPSPEQLSRDLSRRDLLRCAALAGGLSAVGAFAWPAWAQEPTSRPAAQDPSPRFRKAVKYDMIDIEGTLVDKFRLLAELGFDGVELYAPGGPPADEVAAAKEATGLTVHGVVNSVHWREPLSHPDAAIRERAVDALKTAIRAAKDYGGTSVLLVPAVVNDQVTHDQAWERSLPEIEKAVPLAEELEIDILLENVWNNFLTEPAVMVRYIDQFNSRHVGAYFDVGNAVRYAPPTEWIDALGKRIKKLDIKDYDLEKGRNEGWGAGFRVELLEGTVDWAAVIKALVELDYRGWATAEIPGGGRERLDDIAQRMDRIFASA